MGYSKRQFVLQAFEEIGLAAYVFDLTPDQLNSAVIRLDSMMTMWNGKGIKLGYPAPASPENTDLDAETNVPTEANDAIILALASRLAPGYGKTVSMETKTQAKIAYDMLLNAAAFPYEMQMPSTMPSGAGNKGDMMNVPFVNPPNLAPLVFAENGQNLFKDN